MKLKRDSVSTFLKTSSAEIKSVFQNKHQLIQWLISYIAIVLVFTFITSLCIKITSNLVYTDLKTTNQSFLKQTQKLYDSYLRETEHTGYKVITSDIISEFYRDYDSMNPGQRSNYISTIMDSIRSMPDNRSLVLNAFVVFADHDVVIDTTGKYSKDLAYYSHFSQYFDSKEQWLSTVFDKAKSYKKFHTLTDQQNNLQPTVIYNYPLLDNKPMAALIIHFNTSKLNRELQNISHNAERQIYILDGDNKPIFSCDDTVFPFNVKDSDSITANNAEYLVSSVVSEMIPDGRYVQYINCSVYDEHLDKMSAANRLGLIISVIIALFLSYFFSKRNWIPVKKLVSLLISKKDMPIKYNLEYIEENITQLLKEHRKTINQLDEYQKQIFGDLFVRYLNGHAEVQGELENIFEKNNINTKNNSHIIIVFTATDILSSKKVSADKSHKFGTSMMFFLIENILNDLIGSNANLYFRTENNMLICYVGYNEGSMNYDILMSNLSYASEFLADEIGFLISAAVSSVSKDFSELPALYKQALDVISYSFISPDYSILTYDDCINNSVEYSYTIDMERHLRKLIIDGNADLANNYFDELWASNVYKDNIDANMIYIFMVEIAASLLKISMEIDTSIDIQKKMISFCKSSASQNSVTTLDQHKNELKSFIDLLCDFVCDSDDIAENASRYENVKKYIAENYKNPALSITDISDHMGLSVNYLSRQFKANNNIGIPEYITKYRIDRAKILLSNTNMTISKIALDTGFSSSGTFIRAFKHYFGITPGQFRKQ